MNLFFKIACTFLAAFIFTVYWFHYGPQNYLWLSDVGLLLTVGAIWLESPLLISIASVSIMPLEIIWTLDFLMHILTGSSPFALTSYMFNDDLPLYLRAISLYHLMLLVLWIILLKRWGYDVRGWKYATILCTAIFIATYQLKHPFENINLIFTPTFNKLTWISPREWFWGQTLLLPFALFFPMHMLLKKLFARPNKKLSIL